MFFSCLPRKSENNCEQQVDVTVPRVDELVLLQCVLQDCICVRVERQLGVVKAVSQDIHLRHMLARQGGSDIARK